MMRKAERTGTMEAMSALKMSRRLRSRPKRRSTRKARSTLQYISKYILQVH